MKVLVIGLEGQLARSLVERGRAFPDIELVALGRPDLDLEDPRSIRAAIEKTAPDAVINAAAYTAVDQAEDEPDTAFRVNAAGAAEVALAARSVGARIIQISTDYVFDGTKPDPYVEEDGVSPAGAYGRSKLAGEEGVRGANPDHLIVRTSWVYSPFGRNFVRTMVAVARERAQVSVVGDQMGNPSSALDLADGLFGILESWKRNPGLGLGETYHLAGTGSATWFDFASQIFDECRKLSQPAAEVRAITTAEWPTKAVRPPNSQLDCAKFLRDFGYLMPAWRASLPDVVRRLAGA